MRILYLSRWFPYPADNGAKLRTAALLAALAGEHEVDLIAFAEPMPGEADLAAAASLCHSVQVLPYGGFAPRSWRARLRYLSPQPRWVGSTFDATFARVVRGTAERRRPHVVVAGQIDMAPYALEAEGVPQVLEELELGGTLLAAEAEGWRSQLAQWKLRRYVRTLLPHFAAVTVVSGPEAALVESVAPDYSGRLVVLPNGVSAPAVGDTGESVQPLPDSLLYSGAVTYFANLDAVRYFAEAILPHIRRERPAVRLRVTGRTDGVGLGALPGEVEFCGYVPSVEPLLRQSWAVVVPLRVGGGSRLKVLEALAYGTPVVSTPKGIEGLDLLLGRDVLVGANAAEFAQATLRLLNDPALRAELAANGRRAAAACEWSRITPRLAALLEEVVAESGRSSSRGSRAMQGASA